MKGTITVDIDGTDVTISQENATGYTVHLQEDRSLESKAHFIAGALATYIILTMEDES